MKIKTIIAVGLALTLVAASASLVQAGGGGLGIPINVFAVDCYVISGVNPPHEVSLEDQFFGGDGASEPERSPVALGKAKLLCTPAVVGIMSGPAGQLGGEITDHLVCYETPSTLGPKVLKKIEDPFTSQVVQVGSPAFTCVGALKCDGDTEGLCPRIPPPPSAE